MFLLDNVTVADDFPIDGAQGGAQIIAQAGSNGGYAAVTNADVLFQLGYTPDRGVTLEWTPPLRTGPGNIILAPGTRGIRFRNAVAGTPATVSAALSEPLEPTVQLVAGGNASSDPGTALVKVNHNGVLIGSETAVDFEDGTGLTWTVTDDAPNNQVKVTPVLGAVTGLATIYRKNTSKTVTNTVAATDLLNGEITIAAGVLGTTGMLRATFIGDYFNDSGFTETTPRFQIRIGGTVYIDTGFPPLQSTPWAPRNPWRLDFFLQNLAAANSNQMYLSGTVYDSNDRVAGSPSASPFTIGNGTYASVAESSTGNAGGYTTVAGGPGGSVALDTSVANLFELRVINARADANYETRLYSAFFEAFS